MSSSEAEDSNGGPSVRVAASDYRKALLAEQQHPELAEMLRTLVAAGPPPPPKPPEPPPAVNRVWLPSDVSPSSGPAARIVRRHPDMPFGRFEDVPEMRIKNKTRSMFRGRVGRIHSRKTDRTVRTRTDLTFDLCVDCEVDPVVKAFIEEPVQLSYYHCDHWHTYPPDAYQLCWTGFETFVEIKWECDASLPDNEERFRAIGPAVARLGIAYVVLTERHIRRLPRFANIKMLLGDRFAPIPSHSVLHELAAALAGGGTLRIEEIVARYPQLRPKNVHALIWRSFLEIDLERALTLQSSVRAGRRLIPFGDGTRGG